MRDVRASEAGEVRCLVHPDAEIAEEARADNSPGIVGASGAWVYLFCGLCPSEHYSDALARYYVS